VYAKFEDDRTFLYVLYWGIVQARVLRTMGKCASLHLLKTMSVPGISGFCDMKRLGVFLLPLGWDASPSQGYPSIKFPGTHLYTWLEMGTVRVKCLAQEHNIMFPERARTRTARSGGERTDHEATALPYQYLIMMDNYSKRLKVLQHSGRMLTLELQSLK